MREVVTRDSDGATIDLPQEEAEHADTTANAKRTVLVNTSGTATGDKVKITDGTTDLIIWDDGSIVNIRDIHRRIINSKEFFVSQRFTTVADDGTAMFHIKVDSTKSAHGHISIEADGKCHVDFYENPTTSADGTALNELCMNRETDATPTVAVFHTPTKSVNGTLLEYGILGSAGKFTLAGGAQTQAYWLLKPNEQYLVLVTNKSGADVDIVIDYTWHEHTAV